MSPTHPQVSEVERLEGALWYLAATLQLRGSGLDAQTWVDDAKRNFHMGVSVRESGVVTDGHTQLQTRTP